MYTIESHILTSLGFLTFVDIVSVWLYFVAFWNNDFKIDHEIVVDFVEHYKKHFLKKNLANDSTTPNKKKFVLKNKTQVNKDEIKGNKKNVNYKPTEVTLLWMF